MPQPFGDYLGVYTLRQHHGGVSVVQVVEPQPRQTTSLRQALKCLSYEVGVEGGPIGMAKNEIAIPRGITISLSVRLRSF